MTAVGILITATALDAAVTDGLAGLPQETGGILLGFRAPHLVVVTRTLTVPDPRSSRYSYRRQRRRAQARMAAAGLAATPAIGYVGEWHTHPVDCPPSRTDIQALIATAMLSTAPVALIVLAYRADRSPRTHGLTAVRAPWLAAPVSSVRTFPADLTVTHDTAASLEGEATAALTDPEETR